MMSYEWPRSIKRAFWTVAVAILSSSHSVVQAANPAGTAAESDDSLDEVVVTGSLIPQRRQETSTPVVVISADDIQSKGYTSIADALQRSSFSTGAVQGPQNSGGFTQGAQTLSMFGLSPSYTKFLIDGRPIADYPALYNGTDIITSIDGIPEIMVDHIDILPGGQSSIYGSDAIAGVVNISLSKKMTGPVIDLRYGWTKDGGGTEKRIGLADGFNIGNFSFVVSGQYKKTDPIWGYQRPLTDQYYADGSSPQTAERDWLVFGLFGQANGDTYYMPDPASCANVADQFGGSVGLRTRGGRGQYCGTFRSGYYTINNGAEAEQGYVHAAYDVSDHTQIFADVLLDHDLTLFNTGTAFFGTSGDTSGPYNYFFDPQVTSCVDAQGNPDPSNCDLLNVQHIFSPEEAGNLRDQNDKDTKNSVRGTLGIKGQLGASWQYAADMTYTENKLSEAVHLAFTQAINDFFAPVFGPNLGVDPIFGSQPTYNVNFAQFFQPVTPAQYASFTGYATSYSRTEETLARVQLTNSSLFALPGGNAGIALVLEGGDQGWDYSPDPRYLDGETYLFTATSGSGHRSRWAGTAELRLPITSMFTMDISDRYDNYHVSDGNVTKDTFNIGLEFRPLSSLLLRGRYGTSFKAPTLSDEFQGTSGFFQTVTDYYTCTITGKALSDCPEANESVFGTTSGNPQLKPITAKNWDIGVAWTPRERLSVTADFLHWQITNEVSQMDSDQLLRTNSACLLGQLDANSPTCIEAISLVTRDVNGQITQIATPKANVANETLSVGIVQVNYAWVTAGKGEFDFQGSYSDLLKHTFQRFAGDPIINLLNEPFYSTDFKTKANLSATWKISEFAGTLYVEHYGKTPNYAAQQTVDGYAASGASDVGTWTIANLSGKYTLMPGLDLLANINNVFDTMPPVDHSQPGISNQPFNIFNYTNYGRSYYIGMKYSFGH